jgi:hypothetical protein
MPSSPCRDSAEQQKSCHSGYTRHVLPDARVCAHLGSFNVANPFENIVSQVVEVVSVDAHTLA